MRIYLYFAGLLSILLISATAQAQLGWFIDSISDTVNSTVMVPVKVNGFENLISMQGTLVFDPNIISFSSVSLFGLSGLGSGDFGTTNTSNGKLTYSWFDGGLGGQTLPDSTTLFAISFDLVGSMGSTSSITFDNNPVTLEMVDTGFNTIPANYSSGAVAILDTTTVVSASEAVVYEGGDVEVYPNPFVGTLSVAINATTDGTARLSLINMAGKEIYAHIYQVKSGESTINIIDDDQLRAATSKGMYFVQVEVDGQRFTHRIMKN